MGLASEATAHARRLAATTGGQAFADSIVRDYRSAGLAGKERTLLDYVWKLSRTPGDMTERTSTACARKVGPIRRSPRRCT
jgi:hypothetical protein